MKAKWIFVLLCLSFVGELVFGSLFPGQDTPPQTDPKVHPEVKWPLQNEVTITEAIANEAKINTRNLHESGQVQEEKLDSKQDKTEGTTSTTAITTMYTEEKLPVKNATNNVKNIIKESTLTNQ